MASTAQQVRPTTVTKEASFQETKRYLAIALSSIAYCRGLFSGEAYSERRIDSMKVWILRRNSPADGFVTWLTSVYDALEKEYLKQLMLAITYKSPTSGQDMLETYTFGFSYEGRQVMTDVQLGSNGEPIRSTPITAKETKACAQKFITKLSGIASSFEEIGPTFSISMRLTYYDDKTPAEYQPFGFEAGDLANGLEATSDSETHVIGTMQQGFHSTSLVITRGQILAAPMQIPVPEKQQNDMDCQPQSLHATPLQSGTQQIIRCPCGCDEIDGHVIQCGSCSLWQHAVCFCVCLDNAPEIHTCNACADPSIPSLYPTDATLCELSEKRLQEICTWRRALEACFATTSITVTSLSVRLSCEKKLARKIVNQMTQEGIITSNKNSKSKKDINMANLEKAFYRDIQKPSADMRQQAFEARKKLASPAYSSGSFHSQNECDRTPGNWAESPRRAKRRLGISSQESDFKVPTLPKRVKSNKRC